MIRLNKPVGAMLRAGCIIVIALSIPGAALAQNAPLFHFTEAPGPFKVGLRVVEQYDYSRTFRDPFDQLGKPYQGERARPLQTLIWYPAERSSSKPMTVGDYAKLAETEISFGVPRRPFGGWQAFDGKKATFAMPLWAMRDAPLKSGRFPVVIYATSFGNFSWENADLCEFLASHGYVVLASPSMGATARAMTEDMIGIDAQARDISFLLGYAQSLPDVDASRIAAIGYSWGGISNLFTAARDNRIGALVSLDGSLRYSPGLVKQAGDVHPEELTIPLLFFAIDYSLEDQARNSNDPAMQQGPSVLNAWTHGDLVMVRMPGMVHGEYGSMFQRDDLWWKYFPEQQLPGFGREDGIAGYAWMARYTLKFLDAYLKRDTEAMAFLKKTPAENGVPRHFMAASFRQATGVAPSLAAFRAELGRQGFDHAIEIYTEILKEKPDFKLNESLVNRWGYDLIDAQHLTDAIELFKLNVKMYPDSANVYDSLAEAYGMAGQTQLSIENYGKSLEKNPENDNAKEMLKKLENTPPAANPNQK